MHAQSTTADPRPAPEFSIAVTCDKSLVAEAVRAALASRDLQAAVLAWPRASAAHGVGASEADGALVSVGDLPRPPDAILLICDLESASLVRQAQMVASLWAVRRILLTGAPPGPVWGALLAYGVDVVMPTSTSIDELLHVLAGLRHPAPLLEDRRREELLRSWLDTVEQERALAARLESLSARERAVLARLYEGEPVATIAERLDLAPTTVRSHVSAVLRKLGVNSQLSAVALYDSVQGQHAQDAL